MIEEVISSLGKEGGSYEMLSTQQKRDMAEILESITPMTRELAEVLVTLGKSSEEVWSESYKERIRDLIITVAECEYLSLQKKSDVVEVLSALSNEDNELTQVVLDLAEKDEWT